MPKALHESVVEWMNRVITRHLGRYRERSGTRTAELAERIGAFGSTNIEYPSRFSNKNNTKSLEGSNGAPENFLVSCPSRADS
jgi:hypothetical protein